MELVKCRTNDLMVPASAEIILEGEVLVKKRGSEGPHGESQGFYKSTDRAFVMKVNCITHRKKPVSYGLICRPHEDYPKFLFSVALHEKLKAKGMDTIKEVYVPEYSGGALGHFAIIAARVESHADVEKIVEAVHGLPTEPRVTYKPRWLIIVDDDCDVRNWDEVMWRVAMGVMPDQDVKIGPRTNPIAHEPLAYIHDFKASCVVIDATFRSKRALVDGVAGFYSVHANKVSPGLMSKIEARWKEYGLG